MLSAQEMSDRFEIQDLIYRYAQIIDSKNFDALATEIFTADAHIDYSVFGGSKGGLEETVDFLKQAMTAEVFPAHQHLNANLQIAVSGDEASGRVMCFNPQQLAMPDGSTQLFMLGLWYVDKYIRTGQGWRMCERVEEKSWVFNTPDFMQL
jgi:3-phenylpropionate/cinnamic acid dioxygenase small subunit